MFICIKKTAAIAAVSLMTLGMSICSFAKPGEAGGTWDGFETYETWYTDTYGDVPPAGTSAGDSSASESVGSVSEIWWNDSIAAWNFTGNCSSFEVSLYRDGKRIERVQTEETHHDFIYSMAEGGNYTFRVRAYFNGKASEWTADSDIYYTRVDEPSHVHADGVRAAKATFGGPGPGVSTGEWVCDSEEDNLWRYVHEDGCFTTDTWEMIDSKWYYFNEEGYRQSGWFNWNDHTYYCGENGEMVTGYLDIDGDRCVFDTDGVLCLREPLN